MPTSAGTNEGWESSYVNLLMFYITFLLLFHLNNVAVMFVLLRNSQQTDLFLKNIIEGRNQ